MLLIRDASSSALKKLHAAERTGFSDISLRLPGTAPDGFLSESDRTFGVGLFWDAIQDGTELPGELYQLCESALVTILKEQSQEVRLGCKVCEPTRCHRLHGTVPQLRNEYIQKCVANLTSGVSVGQSLQLARSLIDTFSDRSTYMYSGGGSE